MGSAPSTPERPKRKRGHKKRQSKRKRQRNRQNGPGDRLIAASWSDSEELDSDELDRQRQLRLEANMFKARDSRVAAAKAECLDFATAFCQAVPREVRDIVYSYLYKPRPLLPEELYEFSSTPGSEKLRLRNIPDWQRKDTVGPDFAREYTEFFYETMDLHFLCGETLSIKVMPSLLDRDPLGCDVVPSAFIRFCTIRFGTGYGNIDLVAVEPTTLKDQILALKRLEQRSGTITFEVELHSDMYIPDQLAQVFRQLAFLAPIVFELKDQSFNCNIKIVTDMTGYNHTKVDITSLWNVPEEKLVSKLHDWRKCFPFSEEESKALDSDWFFGETPDREGIFLRHQLHVLESDPDYAILKRMLRMTTGKEI